MATDQGKDKPAAKQPRQYVTFDMKAYKRARYATKKAAGLCVACERPRENLGFARCTNCRRRMQESFQRRVARAPEKTKDRHTAASRERRKTRLAEGLCNLCGKTPHEPGRRNCIQCLKRISAHNKRKVTKRVEAGRCRECGKPASRILTCPECTEKVKIRGQKRAQRQTPLLTTLACKGCGKEKPVSQFSRCRRNRTGYVLHCNACRSLRRDPDAEAARKARRRMHLEANGGHFTREEWRAIKKAQDYRCANCGRREPEIKLTVDHIIPVSKGGNNWPSNIQGLCHPCNSSKWTKLPEATDTLK